LRGLAGGGLSSTDDVQQFHFSAVISRRIGAMSAMVVMKKGPFGPFFFSAPMSVSEAGLLRF
jgi:hypothetical protein